MTICKYSQLYLSAATKEQINSVAKKLGKSPEEVSQLVSEADISGKKTYEVWLLKQLALNNIILPEDKDSVVRVLNDFEQLNHRRQLKFTNINQYKSINDLKEEIEIIKPRELEEVYDFKMQELLKLPGVKIFGQNSDYFIVEVSNPESLTKFGDSTDWCTRHLDNARNYLLETGNQYVVYKKENNKLVKFAQFSQDFKQFQDINNKNILRGLDKNLGKFISEVDVNNVLKKPIEILKYNKVALQEWLKKSKSQYLSFVDLSGVEIDTIDDLIVHGTLDLSNCKIGSMRNVRANYLDISNSTIEKIEAPLIAYEHLIAVGSNIKTLPEEAFVYGLLNLSLSEIETLPGKLFVEKVLKLNFSKIKSLPDNLKLLGCSVYLNGCENLKELPYGLEVNNLFLIDTNISKLPEDLIINNVISGKNPATGRDFMDEYLEIYDRRKERERAENTRQFEEYKKQNPHLFKSSLRKISVK